MSNNSSNQDGKSTDKKNDVAFTLVKDEALIAKLLEALGRHKVPLTFWFKEQSLRFESDFFQYLQHLKKLLIRLPIEVGEAAFSGAIKAQGTPQIFASFQIDTVNYFFKTDVLELMAPDAFRIEIPKEIFKLQRRANLRIPFKRHEAPKVSCIHPDAANKKAILDSDLMQFRMLDISAGGIALAVPTEQQEHMGLGRIIKDLRFQLKGTELNCTAIVRHHKAAENEQGKTFIRVGLQFTTLRPQNEKAIAQFVLEESRRMFSIMY